MTQDIKQQVEYILLEVAHKNLRGFVSIDDAYGMVAESAERIIKDLKFELDEAQLEVEIWKNTDEMSQATIKDLATQNEKLVIGINNLQEMNDMSVPQAYENGYNMALKRIRKLISELGINPTNGGV